MFLSKIIDILGCSVLGNRNVVSLVNIHHLFIDSRNFHYIPEHSLFFALSTNKDDGANYVADLIKKGVLSFVINRSSLPLIKTLLSDGDEKGYAILVVEDTLRALQLLATYKRDNFKGQVIGITGSHGKTTLKEMLYDVLKDDYTVYRTPLSYNSQIGVPLSVWQLPTDGDSNKSIGIFEVGISHPDEMDKLQVIVKPTIGVLTNIGNEHDENFLSKEEKRKEKLKLFKDSQIVIENSKFQNIRICEKVMQALGYSEEVIKSRIFNKTHETKLYINLAGIIDNLHYFRSFLSSHTQLICMVKANAYGLGSVEISKTLQCAVYKNQHLVQYLAVAVADEGLELRKEGITLPIIVMNPEYSAVRQIIENNLEPNIYSLDVLKVFKETAVQMGVVNYPIHIKIDSGMHRLGFYKEDMPELLNELISCEHGSHPLRVMSVFSHLACADDSLSDTFTYNQLHYFEDVCNYLKNNLNYPFHTHICNSAGIERFPQYAQDMCRVGIGMYGFSSIDSRLQNVCSLKTTILSVKNVNAGESVGYNSKIVLDKNSRIAVIPIGYADGLDRRLSNYNGTVIVRQKKCPIVGNICMDQTMIDITGTDAEVGDLVIIFDNNVQIKEKAAKLQTIPYELLTSISRRVKREYFYE